MFYFTNFFTYKVASVFCSKAQQNAYFGVFGNNPDKKVDENIEENIFIRDIPIRTERKSPKYPIILCHGFSGFDKLVIIPSISQLKAKILSEDEDKIESGFYFEYWRGIQRALIASGSTVFIAKVNPYGSIEERANMLNKFINKQISTIKKNPELTDSLFKKDKSGKIKVNLVAHSMGGLDSRYLISKINNENKQYEVVSLTTVSTPHKGSEVADYIVDLVNSPETPPKLGVYSDLNPNFRLETSIVPKSIYQLTTSETKKFNEVVPNDPKVKYYSYGARFFPTWHDLYRIPWQIIKDYSGEDSDGLVSIKSAHWGKYLGTLENVDHLDLINWRNPLKKLWRETTGQKKDGFDAVEFYLNIADDLAREGL